MRAHALPASIRQRGCGRARRCSLVSARLVPEVVSKLDRKGSRYRIQTSTFVPVKASLSSIHVESYRQGKQTRRHYLKRYPLTALRQVVRALLRLKQPACALIWRAKARLLTCAMVAGPKLKERSRLFESADC